MKNVKPLLVSGITCATVVAATTVGFAAPASAKPLYSKGFQVYNYVPTGLDYSLILRAICGDKNFEGAPTPPKNLAMGDYDDYELQIHPVQGDERDSAASDITPNVPDFYSTTVNVNMSINNDGTSPRADCEVLSTDPKSRSASASTPITTQ